MGSSRVVVAYLGYRYDVMDVGGRAEDPVAA
jgi:hypothetical protein